MAHMFRKTKSVRSGHPSTSGRVSPVEPPSPDLSRLTQEEINILHKVIQRQEEFENEEASCIWTIQQQLERYEKRCARRVAGKVV